MRGRRQAEDGEHETALLLVNLFLPPDRPGGEALAASYRDRLPAVLRSIETARRCTPGVVYANNEAIGASCSRTAIVAQAATGPLGTWLDQLAPRSSEPLVLTPFASAFENTELDTLLRARGIDTLAIAGATSEDSVLRTALGALERGYRTTIVRDACVSTNPLAEQVGFEFLERTSGLVPIGHELLRSWMRESDRAPHRELEHTLRVRTRAASAVRPAALDTAPSPVSAA